jgi:2-polyprenyl-3-methyl-5-hydroxy-6-metoxy-1,4-benzoquinol methylase
MLLPFHPGPRRREPEIMDQPGLAVDRHRHALRGLARINAWSGSARISWRPLAVHARRIAPRPLRVLDVGCGGGDVIRQLDGQARRAGLPMMFEGCDRSASAVAYAQQQARASGIESRFFVADVLKDDLPRDYDAVLCSLFLHHFDAEEAIFVLRKMAGATRGLVLVNDLRRCFTGWLTAWLFTRLLSRSPIVHVDGPLSVAAAWTRAEVLAVAENAGLHGANYRRCWPFRFLLTWHRPDP